MKKFVIKDTIINLQKPEDHHVYFKGVDGYIHDEPNYADGYQKRGNAERAIKREVNDSFCGIYEKLKDNMYLEAKKWVHYLEIVEVEQE